MLVDCHCKYNTDAKRLEGDEKGDSKIYIRALSRALFSFPEDIPIPTPIFPSEFRPTPANGPDFDTKLIPLSCK